MTPNLRNQARAMHRGVKQGQPQGLAKLASGQLAGQIVARQKDGIYTQVEYVIQAKVLDSSASDHEARLWAYLLCTASRDINFRASIARQEAASCEHTRGLDLGGIQKREEFRLEARHLQGGPCTNGSNADYQ